MELNELKKYLSDVKELEVSLYKQKEIMELLVENKLNLEPPTFPVEPSKDKLNSYLSEKPFFDTSSVTAKKQITNKELLVLAVFCFIPFFLILGLLAGSFEDYLSSPAVIVIYFVGFMILGGFYNAIGLKWLNRNKIQALYNKQVKEHEYRGQNIKNKYETALAKYLEKTSKIDENNLIYSNQNNDMDDLSNKYKKSYDETKLLLEKLYGCGIVYSKYRNMIAMITIFEYIESGRCYELEGPAGAYNLYEDELRKNMIIVKLNEIVSNLDLIRQNQYALYTVMQTVSKDISNIEIDIKNGLDYTRRIYNNTSELVSYAHTLDTLAKFATFNGVVAVVRD